MGAFDLTESACMNSVGRRCRAVLEIRSQVARTASLLVSSDIIASRDDFCTATGARRIRRAPLIAASRAVPVSRIFRRERLRRALIVSSEDAQGRSGLDGVSPYLGGSGKAAVREASAAACNQALRLVSDTTPLRKSKLRYFRRQQRQLPQAFTHRCRIETEFGTPWCD